MTLSAYKFVRPVTFRERGLTMMELLVTVGILGLLMAGLAQLVVTNSVNANATGTISRIADTGRMAIQLLSTDIRRAGYLGGYVYLPKSDNTISGTEGVAEYAINCVPDTTAWARMVNQPVVGINAPEDSGPIAYDCIADEWLQGDVLTLRYASALPVDAVMAPGNHYLRATTFAGRLFLGSEADDPENTIGDPTDPSNPDPAARDYNLTAHTYFVGTTGRSCQGKNIPALFRTTIDDSGFPVSQELLAGVEYLQFRYLVGNRYYDADDVPLVNGRWPTVDAVETTLLVRAECPEVGFTSNRTFDLSGVAYEPEEQEQDFRRQVFTTTTQLRNKRTAL